MNAPHRIVATEIQGGKLPCFSTLTSAEQMTCLDRGSEIRRRTRAIVDRLAPHPIVHSTNPFPSNEWIAYLWSRKDADEEKAQYRADLHAYVTSRLTQKIEAKARANNEAWAFRYAPAMGEAA